MQCIYASDISDKSDTEVLPRFRFLIYQSLVECDRILEVFLQDHVNCLHLRSHLMKEKQRPSPDKLKLEWSCNSFFSPAYTKFCSVRQTIHDNPDRSLILSIGFNWEVVCIAPVTSVPLFARPFGGQHSWYLPGVPVDWFRRIQFELGEGIRGPESVNTTRLSEGARLSSLHENM